MKLKSLLSIEYWNSLLWQKVGEYKGVKVQLLNDPYINKEFEIIYGFIYRNKITGALRLGDRKFASERQIEEFLRKQFDDVLLTFYH